MFTRRDFVVRTAAGLTAVHVLTTPLMAAAPRPIRGAKVSRKLLVRDEPDGRCLLVSDGPTVPRELIRPEAVHRVFGPGVYDTLSQPDHWSMIDAGWFGGEDLFTPVPLGDSAYLTWCALHRPENEAHDLLLEVFHDRTFGPLGAYIPECGLTLAEHPSTPRYATARLDHEYFLPELARHVAERTSRVSVKFR